MPGDANGDERVDAADVVMTNNRILGIFSAMFCDRAADMNGDGNIDQTDIDEIVKLIFSK
jgi:hypothetical protein